MGTTFIVKEDIAATLTTWVYCSFWQLHALECEGKTGYIYWPRDRRLWLAPFWDEAKFAEKPNAFDWYFKQPNPEFRGSQPERSDTWVWENPRNGQAEMLGKHNLYGPLGEIRNYYQKNLHFSDEVEARGQALAQKYSLDFPNLIGITWRGTDCTLDGRPRMPIETYFPFIDEALLITPGAKILATAEEESILDPLLKRYPQAFTASEFYAAAFGSKHNPERLSTATGFERGMVPALMVWTFSKCRHLIKNRASTSSVAAWLSHGRVVSLAHPENLGYDQMLNEAEIEGRRVPLHR